MLVAPAVAWEISAPPTTPRGTSRSSALGLTTLMARSLRFQRVVEPLRAGAADPVVDGLRAVVVLGRLPRQLRGAVLAARLAAALDQRLGGSGAAALGRHEEVVHEPDPRRAGRRPQPVDGGEADRGARVVAGEELDALALRVGDQRAAEGEQRVVGGRDRVEARVAAHQREEVGEVVLADRADPHVVIPVNCPPVMLSTWPCTKFDHGEHRKNTPPAASSGVPGRPMGIIIDAIPRSWSGMPSWTFSPSISITLDSSLEAVSRVSIQPNATALTLILNWPHSLASVFVRPTTPFLPAE